MKLNVFQDAFRCTAGQGGGLRACAANAYLLTCLCRAVLCLGGTPKLMEGGPWMSQQPQPQVTARQAACEGRGSCQAPGFEGSLCLMALEAPELSCRVDTNPLRDTVSSGHHLGSCSAADAFHWERQHQKSMLLDSKWLWSSCATAK